MDRADILLIRGCADWEAVGFRLARGPDLKSQISPLTRVEKMPDQPVYRCLQKFANSW